MFGARARGRTERGNEGWPGWQAAACNEARAVEADRRAAFERGRCVEPVCGEAYLRAVDRRVERELGEVLELCDGQKK